MKTRKGFVSNSSSSSFIIMTAGDKIIIEDGDSSMEPCGSCSLDIDALIKELQEAKARGVTVVGIVHGGGYEG